jgi:hypothetical protein
VSNLEGSFLGNKDARPSFGQGRQQLGSGVNANVASHGKFLNNGVQSKSFAQEMSALLANGQEIPDELKEKMEEMGISAQINNETNPQGKRTGSSKATMSNNEALTGIEENLNKAQADKENLRQEDVRKAFNQSRAEDHEERTSEEKKHYYSSNEATIATAAQENSKAITEAAREGNVGQQEQRPSEDNSRQQQLANWELLAPRLIEDSTNQAIRLDIPDVEDIQTVIVRMGQSGVTIQAIGSEDMVSSFATREGVLRSALAKKNVRLDSVTAFDAKAMYKK